MPLPFDATLKHMTAKYTRDFETVLRLAGPQPAAVLNVDLSTISAASDIVLGYGRPLRALVDLNFQSGRAADLVRRLLLYNALLYHRYGVPVDTVLVLLRPAADDPGLTGRLTCTGQLRRGRLSFTYEVVRLWQRPLRPLLTGGLGTLPLAPLCRLPKGVPVEEALASVIRRIDRRLQAEASSEDAAELLSATFVLTGLRVPRETAVRLFQGVRAMRESSTYQLILEEGREEGREEGQKRGRQEGLLIGVRQMLLRQGRQKFGPPDEATTAALDGITDREQLERMVDRMLSATSWQDLLANP